MISAAPPRRPWVHYATCLWALGFAAPHIWWALGWPFGFPGGPASHRLMMTSGWRYVFDVVVILLSLLGAIVVLALLRVADRTKIHWVLGVMAWTACVMLTLRGIAGLIVDGTADLIWWPTFLAGGMLFGSVAWLSRRHP